MAVEEVVQGRYSEGARDVQESLCCPVDYDRSLLALLPEEIVAKDYGCGDPSRYVLPGDTVLDLGSGGGKICYMAAQLVGPEGRVIGVDMTADMLDLARRYLPEMAERLGGDRVEFKKGYIQDLALDVDALEAWQRDCPDEDREAWETRQRTEAPLIEDDSVDLVVSNCVLNLVAEEDRRSMLAGLFRVLRPGGRVAVSDIVCDRHPGQHLKDDPELWSGCISGAFQEADFVQAFLDAGFVAVTYDKWEDDPWQVVEDIEFRSVTLCAVKPHSSDEPDSHQVIYRGPFSDISDDTGTRYSRGERTSVSSSQFDMLQRAPYAEHFIAISPTVVAGGVKGGGCC